MIEGFPVGKHRTPVPAARITSRGTDTAGDPVSKWKRFGALQHETENADEKHGRKPQTTITGKGPWNNGERHCKQGRDFTCQSQMRMHPRPFDFCVNQ